MLDRRLVTEKQKKGMSALIIVSVIAIVLLISGIIMTLRMVGRSKLQTTVTETVEPVENASEGLTQKKQIVYNGKTYEFNDDVTTILVMGIDIEKTDSVSTKSWTAAEGSQIAGGQADAIFLLVLNPHTNNVSVLAINRNSMADIEVYDEDGNYIGTQLHQICLQHGYGDGGVESCERQAVAVSRFLDDVPINAYAAITMDAIPELNDAVGGIEVTVLDDLIYPEFDLYLHKGDDVVLHGDRAYWYVRLRNEEVFNSQALRLERQKQYMTTFAAVAKKQATSDIRVAINLFQIASKYMTTDIDISQFTYLAGEALSYDFNVENLYSFEGEVIQYGEFEEFYPDEDNKQQILIDLFYEPVEE